MLKGEAKKVYQWEYMRRKRGSNKYYNKRAVLLDPMNVRPISNVRPLTREDVRPKPEQVLHPVRPQYRPFSKAEQAR